MKNKKIKSLTIVRSFLRGVATPLSVRLRSLLPCLRGVLNPALRTKGHLPLGTPLIGSPQQAAGYNQLIKIIRATSNEQRATNSGFTLVEVLVALAITALTLTALMNLLLNSTKLTYQVAQEFNALPVAVEEMEEVKNKDLFLDSVKEVRDYTVKSKIESDSFEDFNYKTLKLEVFYKDVPQIQLYWFDLSQIKTKQ